MSERRRSSRAKGRTAAYVLAGGVGIILLGIVLLVGQLSQVAETPAAPEPQPAVEAAEPAPAEQVPAGEETEARKITATLYYVSANGTELVGITRDVAYGATPAAQARKIAEAQVQPAPEGLFSAIPAGTTVRAVYLTSRGEAYVDLSRELVTGHAGGSLGEALAVYALVNAMVVNLPDVSTVQLLVGGQEIDSIAGHLDLRHPLRRSAEWVQRGQ